MQIICTNLRGKDTRSVLGCQSKDGLKEQFSLIFTKLGDINAHILRNVIPGMKTEHLNELKLNTKGNFLKTTHDTFEFVKKNLVTRLNCYC